MKKTKDLLNMLLDQNRKSRCGRPISYEEVRQVAEEIDQVQNSLKAFKIISLICLLIILFLTLGSCSKQYHFEKFIDKGGKIEPKIEWKTETKTDTIKGVDGKDSIVFRYDSIPFAVYDIQYIPKWQVRFDNKRFEDSLKHIRKMYDMKVDSVDKVGKNAVKIVQSKSNAEIKTAKEKNRFPWVGLIFGVGMILIGIGILKN